MKLNNDELIELAIDAMKRAYVPYSNFRVGAVVVSKSGKIFTGCNVENASYGLSICAERVAIFSTIASGEEIEKLVVVADTPQPVSPCGACRQVMSEFGDFEVVLANTNGDIITTKVSDLLPHAFKFQRW
ncbi:MULTISPECIES: cytidine deaminase [Pseudothermotoga]|jgi:cytidine deaminase|uniref:cytidine deaminase n=1 Tax=Pseudothermotoga TaxID=1643951 RepID=UPI0003265332|nr:MULTISPECIES: cytidine deaminase [Pseudothermotoga]KUK20917.1 MAG: Cytidine deaminase [Pseudothermotoga lettingae]MDI3495924.1 cytidine deaminase [Pseudothermotoga sp.]MDK2884328.1 cytidine deaminase [Pseudothermotoga sp.]HBJ80705.1 cytidine deaminase [Pseudothermotoga sp.]HBT25469.1 cytidine deaminase [Pseudothermotoga sp.]